MTASMLRKQAREALKGKWLTAVLVAVIITVLTSAGSVYNAVTVVLNYPYNHYTDFYTNTDFIANILSIVQFVIGGALTLGMVTFFTGIIRRENVSVGDAFEGFSMFGKAFLLQLVMSIFIMLWTLLFIIPGIIKAYSYSMSYYILRDNPDMSVTEAITRSKELMHGNKFRLFCLHFSYFGWIILGSITVVGIFWVEAYIQAGVAAFYQNFVGGESANCQQI